MAQGKNTTWGGDEYYVPFNIEAAWKNIMEGRKGDGNIREEIQDLKKKKWVGDEYNVVGNFILKILYNKITPKFDIIW